MWLITNFGFFSVVKKSEDLKSDSLTIRSRAKGDLESTPVIPGEERR